MAGEPEEAELIEKKYLEVVGDNELISIIAEQTWENRGELQAEYVEPDTVAAISDTVLRLRRKPRTNEFAKSRFAKEVKTLTRHVKSTASLQGAVPEHADTLRKSIATTKLTATELGHNIPFDGADLVLAGVVQRLDRTGGPAAVEQLTPAADPRRR